MIGQSPRRHRNVATGVWKGGAPRLNRDDADEAVLTRAFALEYDAPVDFCIQRVVVTTADVATGMKVGAALADQNVARRDDFVAEFFHAETLGFRVAPVACAAACFFMSHEFYAR